MGLDLVEIVMTLEEAFGISLPEAETAALTTPRKVMVAIAGKLNAVDEPRGRCLTLRAFNRLRHGFISQAGVGRGRVRLDTRLRELLPEKERKQTWQKVIAAAGLSFLPEMRFGVGILSRPITIKDALVMAMMHAKTLKPSDESWTRTEVRSVVRAVIACQTNIRNFSDDDEFVRDLKLD